MNRKAMRISAMLLVLTLSGCKTTPGKTDTIMRSAGVNLGTVSASAAITEDRATGKITGDTMKYGYINDTTKKSNNRARKMINSSISPAMEKAMAIAIYEIIQQVREKGGNAVTDVVSYTDREYDPETRIETVTVTVTADAVKTDK